MLKNKTPQLAISSHRAKKPLFYTRLNKIGDRHFTTWSEEWTICLLCRMGGFSYNRISRLAFGNGDPKYVPDRADFSRISRVLKANGLKVRNWRNGDTEESKSFARDLIRRPLKSGYPRLKIA